MNTPIIAPPVNKWMPVEVLEITPLTQAIHVDTRDFCCLVSEEEVSDPIKGRKFPIPVEKIKDWLLNLQEISGGKGEWRMMNFKKINADGWFKYIRLYRLDADAFVVCARDSHPVDWRLMTEANLDKQNLYFH